MDITLAGVAATYEPDDEQLGVVNLELSGDAADVGYSQMPIPDATATLGVVTGRRALVNEIATVLLDGFIIDFDRDRGPIPVSTNIVKTVSVEDPNAVLTGFRVNRVRPREMDYARVLAFYTLDAGEKFATMDTTWVLQTNGTRMGKKHYRGEGGWADLIADTSETTGKILFVHDKAGGGRCLHYHRLTEGHTCGLSFSDVPGAANGTTVWVPGNPTRSRTAIDLINDVRALDSKKHEVFVSDSTSQATHDVDGRLHEAWATFETDDLEDLENKANAYLAKLKDDTDTYFVTLSGLDATALSLIRVGDIITGTSTVLDLTAVSKRIAHMSLTVFTGKDGVPAPGLWDARLELGTALAAGASGAGGNAPVTDVVPGAPVVPSSPTPTGIAGQATLHTADNDPDVDATYNYPGGSPAGRLVQGRQYKFVMDIIYNRKVPKGDGTLWDAAMEKVAMQVAETISGSHVAITEFVEPTSGPGLALEGSAELAPTKYLASTGSHWESMWYTYDDVSQDFDIVLGAHATGFYGEETVALCTVYERTADAAPVVPGGIEPSGGQQVNAEPGPLGDGGTTTGRTAFSYLAGSLRVHVNGLDWTQLITSSNPATGDYTLAYAPSLGSTVVRYYQRGATVSGGVDSDGGATPPVVDPGPSSSPELPDTPVDTGAVATAGALAALNAAASEGDVISVPFKHYNESFTIDVPGTTWLFNGSTIDGQSTRSTWITIAAHDVTIQDLLCIAADPDTASAEKSPQTGSLTCNGWNGLTLRNVHLRQGRDAGLYLQHAANVSIIACSSNDNPRSGASIGNVPNLHIQDSQFNDNLTDATYSPLWEGGGYKIGGPGATNIVIERTECSGNAGVGHWIDEHPSNVTYRDCWGHHNEYSTFMYEISTGGSLIRCVSWESGWGDARGDDPGGGDWGWGAGFLVSSAGTVDLTDCISAWDSAGITRINQGDRSNRESSLRLTGSSNTIAADDDRRVSSWHEDGSGNQILFTDASNHEDDLTWYCATGEFFAWDGDVSSAAFAATRGGVGLTEISLVAMQAILNAAPVGAVAGPIIPDTPEAH